jgi:hypothetical protein
VSDDRAVFRASLPPILSAIRFSGDGGMRVQLDIPETDLGEATKLLLWKGTVLRITVEPEQREQDRDWEF